MTDATKIERELAKYPSARASDSMADIYDWLFRSVEIPELLVHIGQAGVESLLIDLEDLSREGFVGMDNSDVWNSCAWSQGEWLNAFVSCILEGVTLAVKYGDKDAESMRELVPNVCVDIDKVNSLTKLERAVLAAPASDSKGFAFKSEAHAMSCAELLAIHTPEFVASIFMHARQAETILGIVRSGTFYESPVGFSRAKLVVENVLPSLVARWVREMLFQRPAVDLPTVIIHHAPSLITWPKSKG
jgi:hypothetical protein